MKIVIQILLLIFGSFCVNAQQVNPFQLHKGELLARPITTDQASKSDTNLIVQPVIVLDKPSIEINHDQIIETIKNDTIIPKQVKSLINPFSLQETNLNNLTEPDIFKSEDEIKNELMSEIAANADTSDTVDNTIINLIEPTIEKPKSRSSKLVFIILLISGLLLSIVFTNKRNIIAEINKSLRNTNYMKLFQKDEKNGLSVTFFLLSIIYLLNISLFVRFVAMYFDIPIFRYNLFFILIVLTLLLALKHLSLVAISYLRQKLSDSISYSFIILMVNSVLGLILIPINALIAYGPDVMTKNIIYLGIAFCLFFWAFKWLRGFLNSARIIIGDSFHFLLYLCGCEIVPILICIGFVRSLVV